MKWYSLFSHTGQETEAVSQVVPLAGCFTNNYKYKGALSPFIASSMEIHSRLLSRKYVADSSIVTLNGYMRILPAEVLKQLHSRGVKVYNIHPALISMYPELRGKDPQEKTYEGIASGVYNKVGVTIHAVDEGVDTGSIVHEIAIPAVSITSKENLYNILHAIGTTAWLQFFEKEMYLRG